MRFNRLVLRGFMSYDELDLDLSEIEMAAIVGDVGAGKSSLLTAITWCLWGKDNRGGEPLINDEYDTCAVRVEFTARGENWAVERTEHTSGRNSTLMLARLDDTPDHVNGQSQTEHKIGETQAKIDAKIGLSFDAITAGPLMIQDQAGTFMDLKPGPQKELIIKIFGVEIYDRYKKLAAGRVTDYQQLVQRASDEVTRLEMILADEDDARNALRDAKYDLAVAQKERETTEGNLRAALERQVALRERAHHAQTLAQTVTSLAQRIEADSKEHTRLLRQLSDAHTAVDEPEPTFEALSPISEEDVSLAREHYQTVRAGYDEFQGVVARLPLLQEQLAKNEKLASIVTTVPCGGEGIYAECRFLTGAPRAEELERQREEIATLSEKVRSLPDSEAVRVVSAVYEDLRSRQSQVAQDLLRRETVVAQWQLRVQNAQSTIENGQSGLNRLEAQMARDQQVLERSKTQLAEVSSDQSAVEAANELVASLKVQYDEQGRSLDMVYSPAVTRAEERVRQIEVARVAHTEASKKMNEAKGKADVYAVLVKAFHQDGIPTMILENGIPLIEEQANEVLARMPEPREVRILTQRPKKGSGKASGMMERIYVVVERNGRRRGYSALSGGERFRIAFALRIGIGQALAHRSGATIDSLILDEGWGSQDEKGVEALLESLAAVQQDFSLILVITHLKAVSDRIQTQIQVSRPEDSFSTVRIAA